jgi:hypothetical protein
MLETKTMPGPSVSWAWAMPPESSVWTACFSKPNAFTSQSIAAGASA